MGPNTCRMSGGGSHNPLSVSDLHMLWMRHLIKYALVSCAKPPRGAARESIDGYMLSVSQETAFYVQSANGIRTTAQRAGSIPPQDAT